MAVGLGLERFTKKEPWEPSNVIRKPVEETQLIAVDDDPMALRLLSLQLQKVGYQTIAIDNGETALEMVSNDTAVVLLDLRMPGIGGLECLRYIRKNHPETQVIVLTGSDEIQDAVNAMKEGAFEYLRKPYDSDELLVLVDKAVETWSMRCENADLKESLSISMPASFSPAQSKGDERQAENISRIAMLDSTVMISGESGTGKSTVARMIHQKGPRSGRPFVAVNCASLPRDLIESELFGHSKGAFTGAIKDRAGRVEVADGGTLFLDEIGDLPLELQPKLLTFLQDRTIQRVGCNEVRKVDVRLIVASHRDLAAMCNANCFRPDLYYRLNVLRIMMPPLREREDEIPMLVANILNRIATRQNIPVPKVSDDAILELSNYPWPGNIRELENVLERAVAFCKFSRISAADLMFDKHTLKTPASTYESIATANEVKPILIPTQTLRNEFESPRSIQDVQNLAGKTLDEIERIALEQTLLACRGNKAKSARMLGISEKSVYNKIKRLGVIAPTFPEESH